MEYNSCHGVILLTKAWDLVAARKSRDVLEMLGDFFREAAVLVLIFYPLEIARNGNGAVPLPFIFLVGIGCIVLLLMGIVLEKMRGK